MFKDDDNHFAKYETIKKLSKEIFNDLSQICLKKYSVKLKQTISIKMIEMNEITVFGRNCNEAKAFLI